MTIALYARVSTQQQAQTQTINQQLSRLRDYCQSQSWSVIDDAIFLDDGYSGASLTRPGLDRLRDAIARGTFTPVILTAPDRLARNYVHQVLLIAEFGRVGCATVFIDRPPNHDPHDQ